GSVLIAGGWPLEAEIRVRFRTPSFIGEVAGTLHKRPRRVDCGAMAQAVKPGAAPQTPQTLGLRTQPPRFGFADGALAFFVIAIVGLMVVPLPTWLLDLLIASNLASSVAVLLVALYVGDALKIAAFPTLLLITTLFRLALNV